jgi:hypothetical protein
VNGHIADRKTEGGEARRGIEMYRFLQNPLKKCKCFQLSLDWTAFGEYIWN